MPRDMHDQESMGRISLRRVVVLVAALASVLAGRGRAETLGSADPQAIEPTRIALRPTARPDPATPLRLGAVASIAGPHAEAAAALVIAPAGRHPFRVDTDHVRSALHDAGPPLSGPSVLVRGSACTLRGPAVAAPASAGPIEATADAQPWVRADETQEHTLMRRIADEIASRLELPTDHVRLQFDARALHDLALSTVGRSVEVRLDRAHDRCAVGVRMVESDRLVLQRSVAVRAEVLRTVAVTNEALRPGQTIAVGATRSEQRWVRPSIDAVAPEAVEGMSVRSGVSAQSVLRHGDIQPAVVVRAGDVVLARCVAGSVVLEMRARALRAARAGEALDVETLEPKRSHRRQLRATAVMPGVVMVDVAWGDMRSVP